ncbi:efflux RND transporter periplasmic adaptor subunit [Marinilabiliaceae bacterium JC017]|nr:efflux RND transporter periplasmic adaptor subunit [Marinilabiliaceae bacterium JC017]
MKTIKILMRISLLLAVVVLTGYKLRMNKMEMAEEATMAKVIADAIPVKAEMATIMPLAQQYEFTGVMEPDKALIVVSEAKGKVIRVYKEKGQYVRKGEVIAKLDDELLQEQYKLAQHTLKKLERDRDRFIELARGNAVTDQKAEEIELQYRNALTQLATTRRYLEDTEIKAPISGLINDDFIDQGQFIAAGNKICEIIDIKNLKIRIEVSEKEQRFISLGQKAVVESVSYEGEPFNARVTWISSKAGQGLKYGVELSLRNTKENALKGGMFATVHFTHGKADRLVVPRKAIDGSLKEPQVFVVDDNMALKKHVDIGMVTDEYMEITAGMKAGDQVVVAGQINLHDHTKVVVN